MAGVLNIFQATPEPAASTFDLKQLTEQFQKTRNTDWSIPEAFLCLLLSSAVADGVVTLEEQAEIHALARRSRALKTVAQNDLAAANAAVNKKLKERPNGVQEACESLPTDMRLPVFAHCVDIILADGELVQAEAEYLNRITGFLGIDSADAKRVMEVMLVKNRF